MRRAAAPLLLLAALELRGDVASIDPEELIRKVVKAQRLAEERLASYTYDVREVETSYDGKGRPKSRAERLFYVYSSEGGEASRELIQVDGRPATPSEKDAAAEKDAKGRKKRLEKRAAEKVSRPPSVKGEDDDPLVGTRRLSDLLRRFDYRLGPEEVENGRLFYVLDFVPRPGQRADTLGDRALGSLAGRVRIDATDFQIERVDARLVAPVKVGGGIAANVKDALVTYRAYPVRAEQWFPCRIDLRLVGKAALFFRLDTGYRFELENFASFRVETESAVVAARAR